MHSNRKLQVLALGILLLLLASSAVRLYKLDEKSLWSDELYSSMIAKYFPLVPLEGESWFRRTDAHHVSDTDTFWTAKAADISPPLFELVTKFTVRLFGPNEIAMRIPSALASILLLVWFAFLAWKERNEVVASAYSWALLFSAISATYIQYAQEARPYSLGVLFSAILCTKWYQRWLAGIDKVEIPKWGEITIFVLACYTHYYLLVLCAILLAGYSAIAMKRRDWKSLLRISFVPLACVPWIFLNLHNLLQGAKGAFAYVQQMGQLEAIGVAFQMIGQIVGVASALAILLITYLLIARILFAENNVIKLQAELRAAYILASVAILYWIFISQMERNSGLFHPRHFVFILPILYLVAGVICSRIMKGPWLALGLGSILLLTQVPLIRENYNSPKEGYREAAEWLMPKLETDDVVITSWNPNRFYYRFYLDRSNMHFQQRTISSTADAQVICSDLAKVKQFGIVAHATHQGLVDALSSSCKENFMLVESYAPYGIVAQLWKNKHPVSDTNSGR